MLLIFRKCYTGFFSANRPIPAYFFPPQEEPTIPHQDPQPF